MDVESILNPVAPDDPCGPNLEYDAALAELERSVQGKPERQMGETIIPAEEPDWKVVEKQAIALLGRSKDLRVACRLVQSRLKLGGLVGFAEGLAALHGIVERYWDGVHPKLDPDDDNDPTMRVNILMELVDGPTMPALRLTPMVSSRLGRFALRDFEVANGEIPPPAGTEPTSKATLEAAFKDADLATVQATLAAVQKSRQELAATEAFITNAVGAGNAPNFQRLGAMLKKIETPIAAAVARLTGEGTTGGPDETGDTNGGGNGTGGGTAPRARRGGGGPLTGDITSREDVISALDRIVAYYAEYEPSSPLPMLLERCKRLVPMSFLDIVKNLVPEAMNHIDVLKGPAEESGS